VNSFILLDISVIPLYKLPKGIWKNRLVPDWYLRVYKSLEANDRMQESQRVLSKHEMQNDLFALEPKKGTKVGTLMPLLHL